MGNLSNLENKTCHYGNNTTVAEFVNRESNAFLITSKEALPSWQMSDFPAWLDAKLAERDWNDSRLAQEAGFSQSVLSKGRGGTGPGVEACVAIARALKVPAGEVLVAAGHIPAPPGWTPKLDEAVALFEQLSQEDQDDFLAFMRRKVERGQSEKSRT